MDDYAASAAMLRSGGVLHGERVLSRPSVALVTTDQLAPSVKACSGIAPGDDPAEDLTAILPTQRAWESSRPGTIFRDFWTTAYQAIDD